MKRRLVEMQEDFSRKMADNKARIDAETEQQKKAFEAMLADMAATMHVGAVGADGTGQGAGVAGVGSAAGKAGAEIPVADGKVECGDEEKREDGGQGGKGDERGNGEESGEGGEGVNGGKVGEGRTDVGPKEEGGPRKVIRGKESAKPLVLMQNKETVRIKEIAVLVQPSGKGVGGLGGVGGAGGIGGVGGKEKKAIDDSDGFDKEDNARGKKDSKGTPRQGGAGGVGGVGGSGKGAKGVGGISKKEAEKEDKEGSEDGSEDEGSVSKMFTVVSKFNDVDANTGEWVCIYCNKSFPFSFQQKALISTHMSRHHAMVLEDSDVLKRQRKRQNVAERKGRKLLEEVMRRRGEGSESRECIDRV